MAIYITGNEPEKKIKSFVDRQDLLGLSKYKKIQWTLKLIKKYKSQLDWDLFSDNLSVPWDFETVNQFKQLINWANLTKTLWGYVGFRKSTEYTTIKWLDSFKEYIDWQIVSEHCWGITPEIVIEFKDKWNWDKLIDNNGVHWSKEAYEKTQTYTDNIDPEVLKRSYMIQTLNKKSRL